MANITTEIRRASHDGERHNKQHCCRGDDPSRGAAATPRLPQGDPADESSKLHHSKSDQRRVLMNTHVVDRDVGPLPYLVIGGYAAHRSEEHTSELQSQSNLVCRLLLEKKKKNKND